MIVLHVSVCLFHRSLKLLSGPRGAQHEHRDDTTRSLFSNAEYDEEDKEADVAGILSDETLWPDLRRGSMRHTL